MPTVPQTQQEAAIWAGLSATGTIPESLVKRGMDKLGVMAFIFRGHTRFLHMLHTRFPNAKVVTTREHPVHEISELDRTFTVTVASTDPGTPARAHNIFSITNNQASQLQPQDMLYHKTLLTYVQGSGLVAGQVVGGGGANIGPDLGWDVGRNPSAVVFDRAYGVSGTGDAFVDPEPMMVLEIGAADSGGSGHTQVTVARCYKGPGAKDKGGGFISNAIVDAGIRADTTNATIKVDDVLLRGLPSFREGTNAPTGVHKNPIIDNNFTQEFKYGASMTKESDIEAIWIGKKPMEIQRMLAMRRNSLDIERTLLFGQKGKSIDSYGKVLYTTGGVVEFIMKDEDHLLTYEQANLTWSGLLELGLKIFANGGSESRDCYCGYSLHTAFRKMFYESGYMRYNPAMSKRFNIEVNTIEVGGGYLNIIPLYNMEEAGWGMRMLCLDNNHPSFVPITHKGWDMKVEKGIQDPGAQIYKEQMIGIKGLERRYQEYHSIVDFPIGG